MVNYVGARIKDVTPGSIGAELELEPGDIVLRINKSKLLDLIDYLMLSSEGKLKLEVLKKSGEILEIEFEKDPDEPLGLVFEDIIFDKLKVCNNRCLFCFVHQLPVGLRDSLYIRDDDYRFSFLQGSYITLTNLSETDYLRIERFHLSPLYISVHATDSEIRQKMLGSKNAGAILGQVRRLAEAKITLHTQAVICPGINDGHTLERTISDLAGLWPSVASLAVVPVGLTNKRHNLYDLRKFQPEEAADTLRMIHEYQLKYIESIGTRFVFAADEWYILAGTEFPPDEEYEGYPQLDNGVGLIRWFLTEFDEYFSIYLPELQRIQVNFVLITGESTKRLWQQITAKFRSNCPTINIEILMVKNEFFGPNVTVTGLLGGHDISQAIKSHDTSPGSFYLLPQVTLKQDQNIFLDEVSFFELTETCLPKQIELVPTRARDWLKWIIDKGSVANWLVR